MGIRAARGYAASRVIAILGFGSGAVGLQRDFTTSLIFVCDFSFIHGFVVVGTKIWRLPLFDAWFCTVPEMMHEMRYQCVSLPRHIYFSRLQIFFHKKCMPLFAIRYLFVLVSYFTDGKICNAKRDFLYPRQKNISVAKCSTSLELNIKNLMHLFIVLWNYFCNDKYAKNAVHFVS